MPSSAHFRPRIGFDTKLSHPDRGPTTSRVYIHCSTILSVLGYRIHSSGRCGMSQSTPLRGPIPSSAHFRPRIGFDTKLSHPDRGPTTSRVYIHCSTILSVLGPDHTLTVLFMGTHIRTSQWVTHHGIALARTRLTSKFRWNPKPVSSQKASC
ncbi:hypothetical protein ACFX2F_036816 [Malus domestica]